MTWQNLVTDAPPAPGTRFVALYDDGSGGSVFFRDSLGKIFDAAGDDLFDGVIDDAALVEWLQDAGYLYWAAMPEGQRLFFEEAG